LFRKDEEQSFEETGGRVLWHASVEVVEKSRHFSNVGEGDGSFKIKENSHVYPRVKI